ncbi:phage portal protein [Arthrobacter sp. H14]|uniref:phage portal protein n=1 Tax=Arthrobacter sp. H14 TaxID=1312959 RepID=UPI00047B9EF8|nr:phage portal protein [Arthrobacter sp. H14]
MNELLNTLLQKLDAPAARYTLLDKYYAGEQALAFLAPEARTALGSRFGRMCSNIPRLSVTALAERLRVTGFQRNGVPDAELWQDWLSNDMDQLANVAHREALTLGTSYVIVWANAAGEPHVSVESARQVAVLRDPGTRRIVAAVKRWETDKTTEAVLYEADTITRLRANNVGAATFGQFATVEVVENPLGIPPVVALQNSDRLLDDGVSEMQDLIPLVDALNKLLADMLVSSEYFARPRRWATGLELEEDEDGNSVNPISEDRRMMVSEAPETKFGQLPAADLSAYEASTRVLLGQIMAVSALPAHYLGTLTDAPTSADSMRASESSLAARADARQAQFGRGWEDVARLMIAVRTGLDPLGIDVRVKWADTSTRSIAQEADAAVKLFTAGLLPASTVLDRLGYTDDEIRTIREARRTEALDLAGTDLKGLLG